jgi:hypothetical protein
MTVWKFTLDITDVQEIAVPIGAEPLHVAMQDGVLCLWALVDPDCSHVLRPFYVTGTGNPAPAPPVANYIGSVHQSPFVWHVWEGIV